MGDILSLIEKAEHQFNEKDIIKSVKKIKSKDFDLNDILEQMKSIKKMGSLQQILSMIPGMNNKIKDIDMEQGESQIKKTEAIIYSMTPKERAKPSIINANRKKRIASGSGTSVQDINKLLRQFEQMQKAMKKFGGKLGKMKKFPNFPGL